jgi:glucose/arabinose dehydrogenase
MRLIRSLLACTLLVALTSAPATGESVRTRGGGGIRIVPVKTGLDGPSAFTFGPGGRIWFAERGTGRIRILDRSDGSVRLFKDVSNVDGSGERGALGLALHPDYPDRPFVYLYVTRTDDGVTANQLLRFRAQGGKAVARRVLFRWPVSAAGNHNGGRILFGPDGNLWIVTGDNADPAHSQQVGNIRGKILRIRPDGGIPATNPFGTRVFAFGIRNSFGMDFDPMTGRLWETENGPSCNDEINRIVRGGNFAWGPSFSCPLDPADADAEDTNRDGPEPRRFPQARFAETLGITGAAFCDGCGLGAGRRGDLFFGDVRAGIWVADLTESRNGIDGAPVRLRSAPTGVHSMEASPGGGLFFSGPDGIYRLVR